MGMWSSYKLTIPETHEMLSYLNYGDLLFTENDSVIAGSREMNISNSVSK